MYIGVYVCIYNNRIIQYAFAAAERQFAFTEGEWPPAAPVVMLADSQEYTVAQYEWGFDALPSSHSEPLPYTPASQFVLPQLRHTYEPHHFSRPPTIDASGPNAQGTRLHSVGMPASHALMRHQGPFPTFGSTPCVVSSVLPSATYPTSWTDSEYRGVYVCVSSASA